MNSCLPPNAECMRRAVFVPLVWRASRKKIKRRLKCLCYTHPTGLNVCWMAYVRTIHPPLKLVEAALILHGAAETTRTRGVQHCGYGDQCRSLLPQRAYWGAWLKLRYQRTLGPGALPTAVVVHFIVDHLSRPDDAGGCSHMLPAGPDAALITLGVKGKSGAPAFTPVSQKVQPAAYAPMTHNATVVSWSGQRVARPTSARAAS